MIQIIRIGDVMPSRSAKQKRTMAAAAHDPKFAGRMGIPRKVAREFNRADTKKGKKKWGVPGADQLSFIRGLREILGR